MLALALALLGPCAAFAKNPEEPETAPRPGTDMTFVDHERPWPLWFGGEVNSIFQAHPSFPAAYTLPMTNSLQPGAESALSVLITGFATYRPLPTTELIVDP